MSCYASKSSSEAGPLRKMSLSVSDRLYAEHRRSSREISDIARNSHVNTTIAITLQKCPFIQEELDKLEAPRTLLSFSLDPPRVFSRNPAPQPMPQIVETKTEHVISEADEIVEPAKPFLALSGADSCLADAASSPHLGLQSLSPESSALSSPPKSPFKESRLLILETPTPPLRSSSLLQSSDEHKFQSPILESSTPSRLSLEILQSPTASSPALSRLIAQDRLATTLTAANLDSAIPTAAISTTKSPPQKSEVVKISYNLCPSSPVHLSPLSISMTHLNPISLLANAESITPLSARRFLSNHLSNSQASPPKWSIPNWSAPLASSHPRGVGNNSTEIPPRTLFPFPTFATGLTTPTPPGNRTPLPSYPQQPNHKRSNSYSPTAPSAKRRKLLPEALPTSSALRVNEIDGEARIKIECKHVDVNIDDIYEKDIADRKFGYSLCERRFKRKSHRDQYEGSRICVRKKGKEKKEGK